MTEITITQGDAVRWARKYKGKKFHALFCDSPYHLTTITKRYGKADSAPTKHEVYARASRGFMGQEWDGGDVAFRSETWEAFKSVMHDGAFGMSFAGSRGWHRLAVAIEDAGFIIHPSIFLWTYGSGFPKATRVKADGFENHRYGLQALKPAAEPIIVFQKPYKGRPIDNIAGTGAGVLNVGGARIGADEVPSNQWTDNAHPFGNGAGNDYETVINQGRWPSNFILMDEGAAQALDRQSGHLVSGKMTPEHTRHTEESPHGIYGKFDMEHPLQETIGDEGGASRFFYCVSDQLDSADPIYYVAKSSGDERDSGLKHLPAQDRTTRGRDTVKEIDRHDGKGVVPVDAKINPRHNIHPTLKPISLNRYLSTLLLPPAKFSPRKIFVPFAGVASEMIGAMQAGWDEIQGVELTKQYMPIAEARIEYWRNKGWQTSLFPTESSNG